MELAVSITVLCTQTADRQTSNESCISATHFSHLAEITRVETKRIRYVGGYNQ